MIEAVNILAPNKGSEMWGTMALKAGAWNMRHAPHRVEQAHRMNGSFPIASSRQEAQDRVRARIETDPEFAQRWEGWDFVFVDLTTMVSCRRDG